MTPVPLHGASSSTRSKPPTTCGKGKVNPMLAASNTTNFPKTAQHSDVTKGKVNRGSLRKTRAYLGELAPVIVADDGIGDSQPVQVAHDTLEPLCIGIIGEDHTCVLHQLSCGRAEGAPGSAARLPRTLPTPQLGTHRPTPSLQGQLLSARPASVSPSTWLPLLLTIFLALPSLG